MKSFSILSALFISTSALAQLWVDPNPKPVKPAVAASAPASAASAPAPVTKCDALSKDATRKERARCAKK